MTMLRRVPGALHLAQHQINIDHLEIDIRLAGRIGVHRQWRYLSR